MRTATVPLAGTFGTPRAISFRDGAHVEENLGARSISSGKELVFQEGLDVRVADSGRQRQVCEIVQSLPMVKALLCIRCWHVVRNSS